MLEELGKKDNPLLEIAKELENIAVHDDYFVQRKLFPNVDFYSGIILEAMGIPTRSVKITCFIICSLLAGFALSERPYGDDVTGCPADHLPRLVAHGQHVAGLLVESDHRRFVEDDPLSLGVDERVGGTQIDGEVAGHVRWTRLGACGPTPSDRPRAPGPASRA